MASIFVENFEGGTSGATATVANTAFNSYSGANPTFTTTPTPPQGSLAIAWTAAAATAVFAQNLITATPVFFRRLYAQPTTGLTGGVDMLMMRGSNAIRSRVRLNADYTVSIIAPGGGGTVLWTSVTTVPTGQWSCVEYRADNNAGQQQVRLWLGTNPLALSLAEDSGARLYNQGTIDAVRIGMITPSTTGSTTIYYDAVADDDADWVGPLAAATSSVSVSAAPTVTLTGSVAAISNAISVSSSISMVLQGSIAAVPVVTPPPPTMHTWSAWARDTNYFPSKALLIDTVQIVRKHMGVDTAVVTTPFSPEAWAACAPSNGVIIYRDGRQQFSGPISARQFNWDAETDPRPLITLECLGDEQHLADRPVFPNPLQAADNQTTTDHWALGAVASTAMWQLISDQAGPTCRADRQVSGLVMGANPGVGLNRIWRGLYFAAGPNGVMDALAAFSASSGEDLGVRITSAAGQLLVDVVQPRDLTDDIKFATDIRNLVGIFYRETAPTTTHALANGSGTLASRVRKLVVTTSALALAWGRQVWAYVDRSDTSDLTELANAAQDAIDQGVPTVSLTVRLTDTQAATYGKDWDLGDKVTVYVGLPGQTQVATVADVVRQVSLSVDNTGKEIVQPAIGSYDAKAIRPTPTQEQLAAAVAGLNNTISRK